ncbi:MAG: AsmA family protein [Planctomycetota bacterium]|jgi:Arc/MetJ family transcription regulator
MAQKTRRPRRLWKKVVLLLGGLFAVAVLLAALAPTMVSRGLGHGLVRRALGQRVNGTVDFGRLELRWFRPQSVRSLTITDVDGNEAARVDLDVNAGLFNLLSGRTDLLEIDLAGYLRGMLREDGSTTFDDLIARPAPGQANKKLRDSAAKEPFALRGVPATTLRMTGLGADLRDAVRHEVIELEATGEITYRPGTDVTFDIQVGTKAGERRGSVNVAGAVERLFDAAGVLTPQKASVRIDVDAQSAPVPLSRQDMMVEAMKLTATSDDLTEALVLSVEADALIDGIESGRLEGTITAERPVRPDGSLDLGLDRITGRIVGRSVPAALLQPLLKKTPIIVSRDVGPTIDVDATLSAEAGRMVNVSAKAKAVELAIEGTVDPQARSIRGDRLRLAATVAPALLDAVTGVTIDRPSGIEIVLDSFSLPPAGEALVDRLRLAGARGTVTLAGPAVISAGDRGPFSVRDLVARLDTAALGEGLALAGTAAVDETEASFELSVSGLFAQGGATALERITPVGRASLRGLTGPTLARVMPDQASLIEAAVAGPLDVTLTSAVRDGELHATLRATGDALNLELVGARRGPLLHVAEGRGSLTVTPRLAAVLQEERDEPIVLTDPVAVSAEAEPFDVAYRRAEAGDTEAAPIRARLTARDFVLDRVPRLVEPIGIGGFFANVTARAGEAPSLLSLEGRGQLRRAVNGQEMGDVRYAVTGATTDAGQGRQIVLDVTGISVRRLERVLGLDRRDLSDWIGDQGNVTATLAEQADGYRASCAAAFPLLAGDFGATMDDEMLTITAERPRVALSRNVLQRRLSPAAAGEGRAHGDEAPPPAGAVVEADVPLTLTIKQLRLPRAILDREPIETAAVDIDLVLSGGPLVLSDPSQGKTSIEQLEVTVRSDDLVEGLDLTVRGNVVGTGTEDAGLIELDGKLTGLLTDERVFSATGAGLDLTTRARGVPTAVVDALGNLKGLLVAAVGSPMAADATATNFSPNTGGLYARIETPNGKLEGRVSGSENALRIGKNAEPVRAELEITPPLRERLLYKIHPLLADIRSTEQPLRATLGNAIAPLDGDVYRLRADIEITIGPVELDSGSVTLALLTLFNATNAATIPGEIEPIVARIRNGVVTYDRFAVKIDKYTLVYSGRVDLNTRTVDLRTEIPLEALAMSVEELEGYADKIVVPLVTRGPFGKVKTDLDPEFDLAGAALDAGFRGALEDAAKETGVPIGDILDGILKGGKKKKEGTEGQRD